MPNKENEKLEYKKSTSEIKQAVVSLASMLNKNGEGVLYFGVLNDGTVVGQQLGQDTTRDVSTVIKNYIRPMVSPKITTPEMDGKTVIKVEVRGEDTPYAAYGRYYLRSDDEDNQMTNRQLESFFLNKNVDYSKWENELTDYGPEVIDEELLIDFVNKGNEVGRITFNYRDAQDTLQRLNLIKDGRLKNAGVCLFSTLKPLTLKLAVYATDARLSFIDNRIFKGNLFECIEAAYQYFAEHTRWRAEIVGMERVETPEVPIEAVREIIVNSFAHMKVNESSFNELYITPSRIHVYNPGFLVKDKSPLDFASGKEGPVARNPLINTVLYLNKTIESFGTGFARVFDACDRRGVKYNYGNNSFGFYFEFMRKPIYPSYQEAAVPAAHKVKADEDWRDMVSEPPADRYNAGSRAESGLTESKRTAAAFSSSGRIEPKFSPVEQAVYTLIASEPGLTKKEMAERIGKSEATVQRAIACLTAFGRIERVGSNKTGYWRATELEEWP